MTPPALCSKLSQALRPGVPLKEEGPPGWSAWASEHFKPCSRLAALGPTSSRPGPSTMAVPLPSRQCRAHLLGPVPPQVPPCGEQSRAWLSILQMRKPRPRKGMPYLRVWLNPNQLTVFVYF